MRPFRACGAATSEEAVFTIEAGLKRKPENCELFVVEYKPEESPLYLGRTGR